MGRTEGDTTRGSLGAMVVVERTSGRSPLVLMLGGSCSPVRGEPPLQWMSAQDPTSALFSLDDATESMERENLDIRFLAMMDALSQARGILCDVIIPLAGYALDLLSRFLLFFMYSCIFVFLILVFFSVPYCS